MDLTLVLLFSLAVNIVFLFIIGMIFFFNYTHLKDDEKKIKKQEEQILDQTREKSQTIIHRAVKQANKILSFAELRGIRLFSAQKLEISQIVAEHRLNVRRLEQDLSAEFEKRLNEAEGNYKEFIKTIEKSLEDHINKNRDVLEQKANQFIEGSQETMMKFVTDMHTQIGTQINQELASAKAEIDTYKKRRMKILNENIIEILEKTVSLALGKKLTLGDQSDLIYKALEEAKKEHALE